MGLTVGELTVLIDAQTDDLRRELKQTETRLKRFEKQAKASTRTAALNFTGLGFSVGNLVKRIGLLTAAVGAVGLAFLARSAIENAAAFETLEVRLSILTGSAQGAADVLANLEVLATRTPFSIQGLAEAAASLAVVFKGSTDEIDDFTKIVANLAAATGRPIEQIGENLQRAFSAGLGAADVLRETGISALILEISGASQVAEVDATKLNKALRDLAGETGRFGTAASDAALTLSGSISNIGVSFDNFARALGDALSPGIIAIANNVLIPFFERLQALVTANADAIGTGFVDGVRTALGFIAGFLRSLSSTLSALGQAGITVGSVSRAFRTLGNVILLVTNAFSFLAGLANRTLAQILVEAERVTAAVKDLQTIFTSLENRDIGTLQRQFRTLSQRVELARAEVERLNRVGVGGSTLQIAETQLRLVQNRVDRVREAIEAKGFNVTIQTTDAQRLLAETEQGLTDGAGRIGASFEAIGDIINESIRDAGENEGAVRALTALADQIEAGKTLLDGFVIARNEAAKPVVLALTPEQKAIETANTEVLKIQRERVAAAKELIPPLIQEANALRVQIDLLQEQLRILDLNGASIEELTRAQKLLNTLVQEETILRLQALKSTEEATSLASQAVTKAAGKLPADAQPLPEVEEASELAQDIGGSFVTGIRSALEGGSARSALASFGDALAQIGEDSLTKALQTAFETAVDGFADLLSKVLPDSLSGLAGPLAGVLGAAISSFLRADEISSAVGNVQSAVTSAQQVRGIVAGPQNIAIAQVGPAIERAFEATNAILAVIAENTSIAARAATGISTGSIPSGGLSPATAALGNEGPSLF